MFRLEAVLVALIIGTSCASMSGCDGEPHEPRVFLQDGGRGGADGNYLLPPSGDDAGADAAGTDAAGVDASLPDASSKGCVRYCSCSFGMCSSVGGFPFASTEACLAICGTYSTAELECWSLFCDQASMSPIPQHLCEHSWGLYDLNECP